MATIGPSIDQPDTLHALIERGVRSFRIPASKRDRDQTAHLADLITSIGRRQHVPVDVFLDLPGGKSRLTNEDPVAITAGGRVEIRFSPSNTVVGTDTITFGCTGPSLADVLVRGDVLVVGDGEIALEVTEVSPRHCATIALADGTVLRRHGVTRLGGVRRPDGLVAADRLALGWMSATALTGVMISFVESPRTVREARRVLTEAGAPSDASHIVIAKVETGGGVERCYAIAREADAVLLGRGDLLIDVGTIAFHAACEEARAAAQAAGRPFIIGTQLLTSLLNSWLPHRSELSEVSRLIDIGTECLLLSDETIWFPDPMRAVDLLIELLNAAGADPLTSLGEQIES